MTIKTLNPLDASWLLVESRDTPMHVGGLIIFQLPEDAPEDYFRDLVADFRNSTSFAPPWNLKLRSPGLKGLIPVWESTDEVDLEHHLRHSALPRPGGERELGQLIARLHSQPLDMHRPLWECALIEGLENRRFAIYTKMHHSMIDGISGMKMLVRSMATDPAESLKLPAFWAIGSGAGNKPARKLKKRKAADAVPSAPSATDVIAEAWNLVRGQIGSVPGVARAFGTMLGGLTRKTDKLMVPFDTPSSVINTRIRSPRRFATQIYAIDRLRAVAQAAGGTLNDVVLAICGGALRRFLLELDQLPKKPLTAGIPVSVRPKDDEGTGNAITFIISTLGTDIDDPLERLQAITDSTRRAKEHMQSLPRQAMTQYTMVLMAPYILSLLTGMGGRTRPMFNVTISNVPGPDQPLYFRGARMEATYPVSLLSHGQALNITCQSYAGQLAFGFTGCRDTLPHMQRLATYTGEALAELEQRLAEPARVKPAKKAGKAAKGEGRPEAKLRSGKAPGGSRAKPSAAKPVSGKSVKTDSARPEAGKVARKANGKSGKADSKAAKASPASSKRLSRPAPLAKASAKTTRAAAAAKASATTQAKPIGGRRRVVRPKPVS
jgi:WS/DGAT/MGAT family acyltransferase